MQSEKKEWKWAEKMRSKESDEDERTQEIRWIREKNDSSKQHTNKLWPKILSFCSIMEMLSRHRCLSAVENQTNHKVIHMNRAMSSDYILLTCIHKHKHKHKNTQFIRKICAAHLHLHLHLYNVISYRQYNNHRSFSSRKNNNKYILLDLFTESQHRI